MGIPGCKRTMEREISPAKRRPPPSPLERTTTIRSRATLTTDRKSTRLKLQSHRDLHSFPTRRSSDLVQTNNGTGNFSSEAATATFTIGTNDNYPEPRNFDHTSLLGTNLNGNSFNSFFPWQANEDGSGHEIIIHAGRHDFLRTFPRSFTDDTNLVDFNAANPPGRNFVDQLLHISESPVSHGIFYSVDGPDFGTHGAGQIVSFNAPGGGNADLTTITYVTPKPGIAPNSPPLTNPVDIYRTPELLSDGALVASHTQADQTDHRSEER